MSSSSNVYETGEIVWVKLSHIWWPGEVCDDKQVQDEIKTLKKKPIAVVKFFNEGTYEYVKNTNNINKYNCSKKYDFIKKGIELSKSSKKSFAEKFPADIVEAERLTDGNINILQSTDFSVPPNKRQSIIKRIFGDATASPSKSVVNNSSSKEINNPRFLSDLKGPSFVYVKNVMQIPRPNSPNAPPRPPSPHTYKCHLCSFTTPRQNVIILHTKTHTRSPRFLVPTLKDNSIIVIEDDSDSDDLSQTQTPQTVIATIESSPGSSADIAVSEPSTSKIVSVINLLPPPIDETNKKGRSKLNDSFTNETNKIENSNANNQSDHIPLIKPPKKQYRKGILRDIIDDWSDEDLTSNKQNFNIPICNSIPKGDTNVQSSQQKLNEQLGCIRLNESDVEVLKNLEIAESDEIKIPPKQKIRNIPKKDREREIVLEDYNESNSISSTTTVNEISINKNAMSSNSSTNESGLSTPISIQGKSSEIDKSNLVELTNQENSEENHNILEKSVDTISKEIDTDLNESNSPDINSSKTDDNSVEIIEILPQENEIIAIEPDETEEPDEVEERDKTEEINEIEESDKTEELDETKSSVSGSSDNNIETSNEVSKKIANQLEIEEHTDELNVESQNPESSIELIEDNINEKLNDNDQIESPEFEPIGIISQDSLNDTFPVVNENTIEPQEKYISTEIVSNKEIYTENNIAEKVAAINTENNTAEEVPAVNTENNTEEEVPAINTEYIFEEEVPAINTDNNIEEEVPAINENNTEEEVPVIDTENSIVEIYVDNKEVSIENKDEEELYVETKENKAEEEVTAIDTEHKTEEEVSTIDTENEAGEKVLAIDAENKVDEEMPLIDTENKSEEAMSSIVTENKIKEIWPTKEQEKYTNIQIKRKGRTKPKKTKTNKTKKLSILEHFKSTNESYSVEVQNNELTGNKLDSSPELTEIVEMKKPQVRPKRTIVNKSKVPTTQTPKIRKSSRRSDNIYKVLGRELTTPSPIIRQESPVLDQSENIESNATEIIKENRIENESQIFEPKNKVELMLEYTVPQVRKRGRKPKKHKEEQSIEINSTELLDIGTSPTSPEDSVEDLNNADVNSSEKIRETTKFDSENEPEQLIHNLNIEKKSSRSLRGRKQLKADENKDVETNLEITHNKTNENENLQINEIIQIKSIEKNKSLKIEKHNTHDITCYSSSKSPKKGKKRQHRKSTYAEVTDTNIDASTSKFDRNSELLEPRKEIPKIIIKSPRNSKESPRIITRSPEKSLPEKSWHIEKTLKTVSAHQNIMHDITIKPVESSKEQSTAPNSAVFDFQDDDDTELVLTSLTKLKKKYMSSDKFKTAEPLQMECQKQIETEKQDEKLKVDIENLLNSTKMSDIELESNLTTPKASTSTESPPIYALPIKERGKRFFKSRNISRNDEPNTSAITTNVNIVKSLITDSKQQVPILKIDVNTVNSKEKTEPKINLPPPPPKEILSLDNFNSNESNLNEFTTTDSKNIEQNKNLEADKQKLENESMKLQAECERFEYESKNKIEKVKEFKICEGYNFETKNIKSCNKNEEYSKTIETEADVVAQKNSSSIALLDKQDKEINQIKEVTRRRLSHMKFTPRKRVLLECVTKLITKAASTPSPTKIPKIFKEKETKEETVLEGNINQETSVVKPESIEIGEKIDKLNSFVRQSENEKIKENIEKEIFTNKTENRSLPTEESCTSKNLTKSLLESATSSTDNLNKIEKLHDDIKKKTNETISDETNLNLFKIDSVENHTKKILTNETVIQKEIKQKEEKSITQQYEESFVEKYMKDAGILNLPSQNLTVPSQVPSESQPCHRKVQTKELLAEEKLKEVVDSTATIKNVNTTISASTFKVDTISSTCTNTSTNLHQAKPIESKIAQPQTISDIRSFRPRRKQSYKRSPSFCVEPSSKDLPVMQISGSNSRKSSIEENLIEINLNKENKNISKVHQEMPKNVFYEDLQNHDQLHDIYRKPKDIEILKAADKIAESQQHLIAPVSASNSQTVTGNIRITVDSEHPLSAQIAHILAANTTQTTTENTTFPATTLSKTVSSNFMSTSCEKKIITETLSATMQNTTNNNISLPPTQIAKKRKQTIEEDIPSFIIDKSISQERNTITVDRRNSKSPLDKNVKITDNNKNTTAVKKFIIDPNSFNDNNSECLESNSAIQSSPIIKTITPPKQKRCSETITTAAAVSSENVFDISTMPILLTNEDLLRDNIQFVIAQQPVQQQSTVIIQQQPNIPKSQKSGAVIEQIIFPAAKRLRGRPRKSDSALSYLPTSTIPSSSIITTTTLPAKVSNNKKIIQQIQKIPTNLNAPITANMAKKIMQHSNHQNPVTTSTTVATAENSSQTYNVPTTGREVGVDIDGNSFVLIPYGNNQKIMRRTKVSNPIEQQQQTNFINTETSLTQSTKDLEILPIHDPKNTDNIQKQLQSTSLMHQGTGLIITNRAILAQNMSPPTSVSQTKTYINSGASSNTGELIITPAYDSSFVQQPSQSSQMSLQIHPRTKKQQTATPVQTTYTTSDGTEMIIQQIPQKELPKVIQQQIVTTPPPPTSQRGRKRKELETLSFIETTSANIVQQPFIKQIKLSLPKSQLQHSATSIHCNAELITQTEDNSEISEQYLQQHIITEEDFAEGKLTAVPADHFGLPGSAYYLCCHDNEGNYMPMDNQELYLDAGRNQLVPLSVFNERAAAAAVGAINDCNSNPIVETGQVNLIEDSDISMDINDSNISNEQDDTTGENSAPIEQSFVSTESSSPVEQSFVSTENSAPDEQSFVPTENPVEQSFVPTENLTAEQLSNILSPGQSICINIENQQLILDQQSFLTMVASGGANTQIQTLDGQIFNVTEDFLSTIGLGGVITHGHEDSGTNDINNSEGILIQTNEEIPTNPDILTSALIDDVLQIETSQGVQIINAVNAITGVAPEDTLGPAFQQVTAQTNETNALLTQPPIMSTLEVPSNKKRAQSSKLDNRLLMGNSSIDGNGESRNLDDSNDRLLATPQNLEDCIAFIGVSTQSSSVPSSLELPITVTNPAIAPPKTSAPLGALFDTKSLVVESNQISPQLVSSISTDQDLQLDLFTTSSTSSSSIGGNVTGGGSESGCGNDEIHKLNDSGKSDVENGLNDFTNQSVIGGLSFEDPNR